MWWYTPLIPALGRQRHSEFEASLVYKVSARTARVIQRNLSQKKPNQNQNKTKQNKNKNKQKKRKSLTLFLILCMCVYVDTHVGLYT